MPTGNPQNIYHQYRCPDSEQQQPLPLQETLQYQQVGLAQAPMRSLLFQLGPRAHETCVPSENGICFPQSCDSPVIKPCWPSKPNALGSHPPDARPPA